MKNSLSIFAILILIVTVPLAAWAQQPAGIQTFHDLPGLSKAGNLTTQQYIEVLYTLAITIAAILAVLKLIWAGVQYMLSEVVTSKQKAKQDIQGALLGLVIILVAVTLLNTINPNLTNLNFLRNATPTQPIKTTEGNSQLWRQSTANSQETDAEISRCKAQGGSAHSLSTLGTGGSWVTCYKSGSEPTSGPTSCPQGQTRISTVTNGIRTYSCTSASDIIPGGSGTENEILGLFDNMAAYEAWCTAQGGSVIRDDAGTTPNYSCRR